MADPEGWPEGWDTHVHVFDAGAPVQPGHYTPDTRALHEIETVAQVHGIGHLVLVQPSVYGTDNGVLLRALGARPGRHRGIVVIDSGITDAQLDAMHEAGVRGVRFNLVSPVGNGEASLPALAPRLRERGWHAQWYVRTGELPRLVRLQQRTGLTFVLDHLAGIGLEQPTTETQWQALAELAAQGAWLKLSGWYRLGSSAPYAGLVPLIRRASEPFGERIVWGSDWPHTSLPSSNESRHESLLRPLSLALGGALAQAVLHSYPPRLYA